MPSYFWVGLICAFSEMHRHEPWVRDKDDVSLASDCGQKAGESWTLGAGLRASAGDSTHPLHSKFTLDCRDNRRLLQRQISL